MDKNLKPYATTKRRSPFDWLNFLIKPERTQQEWAIATEKAASWVSCACGNQCAVIPRDFNGEPMDKKLRRLGCDFFEAISERELSWAENILRSIEYRSAYLIRRAVKAAAQPQ